MLVWIDAAACGRAPKIFGLTLVERHLQALKRALPRPARIVVDFGSEGQKPDIDSSLDKAFPIEWRQQPGDFPTRLTAFLREAGNAPVMLLDGATLPDARLHAALVPLAASVAVLAPKAEERAALIRAEAGVLANQTVTAPDLTTFAEQAIAAGTLPNTEANLRRWITDPDAVKPGAHMPPFDDLAPDELDALVLFLGSLRR